MWDFHKSNISSGTKRREADWPGREISVFTKYLFGNGISPCLKRILSNLHELIKQIPLTIPGFWLTMNP